jgi:phage terminase large subunit-like protein
MVYFFNLAGAIYDPDVVGLELPSLGAARVMAAKHAGEVLRDRPGVVWQGEELRVEVTDSDQLVLFTLIVLGVDAPCSVGKQ